MDNGMGGNGGSNGILMEDEIVDTPAVSTPPQTAPQQPAQPQYGAAGQSQRAIPQPRPTAQPQYTTTSQAQQTASAQSQNGATASAGQASGMDAFNSAPSFDSMDGMNMSSNVMSSSEIFGSSTGATSTGWEDRHSDQVFRGSAAGRSMSVDNAVYQQRVSSNIFLGFIGALIGALLGAVLWVVIYELGYLGGIAGAAIVAFSMIGYVILGRTLDVKGVIVCAVLSIVTIYLAHRVAFSIEWIQTVKEVADMDIVGFKYMDMSFKSAFFNVEKNLKYLDELAELTGFEGFEGGSGNFTSQYYSDLFAGYVVSVVIGVMMVKKMIFCSWKH